MFKLLISYDLFPTFCDHKGKVLLKYFFFCLEYCSAEICRAVQKKIAM